MNRKNNDWSLKNRLLRAYCWCLILGLLYLLSIGPGFWFWYDANYLGRNPTIELVYRPLVAACEVCKPLDDFVLWYVELWNP